ncbi:MAG: CHAP domain-containing protein [Christensenellales bacterium]
MSTRIKLAETAKEKARLPFHGFIEGKESNIQPIVSLFPKWNIQSADRMWCAGFVYYCCIEAGFKIPYSPKGCVSCSLAGCGGWEEFALKDSRIEYHPRSDHDFTPAAGDIVLYDHVFINREHDHIGIVLEDKTDSIIVAEGNTYNDNISRILERKKNEHIRAYIRIPNGYSQD